MVFLQHLPRRFPLMRHQRSAVGLCQVSAGLLSYVTQAEELIVVVEALLVASVASLDLAVSRRCRCNELVVNAQRSQSGLKGRHVFCALVSTGKFAPVVSLDAGDLEWKPLQQLMEKLHGTMG